MHNPYYFKDIAVNIFKTRGAELKEDDKAGD